jgi:hypothetical protein
MITGLSLIRKLHSQLVLLAISTIAAAEIDSGGGHTSGGAVFNYSSIGSSFATPVPQGEITRNHPGLIEVIYPVTPSSNTDINQNNLSDGWEVQNFGSLVVDPSADADHDGTSNLMEYLSGTDPNNANSVFRPKSSYTNGTFSMLVATISGRNYQIWVTRDLQSWALHSTFTGNNLEQLFTFDENTIPEGPLQSPTHPSTYFFKVRILIP